MPGMENVKSDRHFPSVLPFHFSCLYYDLYSLNVEFSTFIWKICTVLNVIGNCNTMVL